LISVFIEAGFMTIYGQQKIVYCSGSQYSLEERDGMLQMATMLEANGYETYLPFRDGFEFRVWQLVKDPGIDHNQKVGILDISNQVTFALDTFQIIKRCDALVFNMNGRTPEEGAVFRTALAYSVGTPLVLYKNDNRSIFNGKDNTMITGLSGNFTYIKKLAKLPKAIKIAMAKANRAKGVSDQNVSIPPYLERVITLGELVWGMLTEIGLPQPEETDFGEQMLELKDRCGDLLAKTPIKI